jgi:hypothetical protein
MSIRGNLRQRRLAADVGGWPPERAGFLVPGGAESAPPVGWPVRRQPYSRVGDLRALRTGQDRGESVRKTRMFWRPS